MKVSKNWLEDYLMGVSIEDSKLGEILTDIGLEVEGMECVEKIRGSLEGVKVGKVLTCEQHPNADRLSLTTVDVGGESPLQIVCGAPNVAAGQSVLVATIGTTLYDASGTPWKIKKGKIRGETSEGMICAEDELGLGTSHEGILVLDGTATPGTPASELYSLDRDTVYDVGLTPNRSDATGHIGVAKDVWAFLKVNTPSVEALSLPETIGDLPPADNIEFQIEIRDLQRCPRYSGLLLKNVKVAPSPDWMQFRLKAIGVRPINNIVDITNYILHEYGQPLHAFDADKIKGRKIIVETKPDNTPFVTLDEVERKLSDEDLMICDGEGTPMCIAGVFGGLDTGVTEATTHIFLESAHFNAKSIRKTSFKHQLRTDAAMRFEKGSDPNITVDALRRAAYLMEMYADAEVVDGFLDNYPKPVAPARILLRYEMVNRLIGAQLKSSEIEDILRAMDMNILPNDDQSVIVEVPTNKSDVLREVDLIEEILRIYGYNKVPIPDTLSYVLSFKDSDKALSAKRKMGDILTGQGYLEMMGLSLMSSQTAMDTLNVKAENLVLIHNTSNTNLDTMRPDLILSGLESVAHNLKRQQRDLKLFEWGRVYRRLDASTVEEEDLLCILVTGEYRPEHWKTKGDRRSDYYDVQSITRALLKRLGIDSFQEEEMEHLRWDYGMKYFRGKQLLAEVGCVSKKFISAHHIKQPVFGALLHWENILKASEKVKVIFEEIPKTPTVRRDLAVVMDKGTRYAELQKTIKKAAGKLLTSMTVFDIYESKEHLGEGKISYAIKMIFQDTQRTLRDKDIEKIMNKVIQSLEEKLSVSIRK